MKRKTSITKPNPSLQQRKTSRKTETRKSFVRKSEIPESNTHHKNTLKNLLEDLESVSIPSTQFLTALSNHQLKDISGILDYFYLVYNRKNYHPENLLFHYRLLELIPPKHHTALLKLLRENYTEISFSKETLQFIENEKVSTVLDEMIFQYLGLSSSKVIPSSTNINASLRSKIRLLESIRSLVTEDPNIGLYFQKISLYGNLQSYYLNDTITQKILQKITHKGFDIDYILFNVSEIQSIGPSKLEKQTEWNEKLLILIKKILGSKDEKPEIDIQQNRNKLFASIKDHYKQLKEKKDKNAALQIITILSPVLEKGYSILKKQDLFYEEAQLNNLKLELDYLKNILEDYDGAPPKPRKLFAVRSQKKLPDLLFDNTRLSCCIFKPSGLFHGEITRLALNPTTPIIEFWLEPYQEFLGVATLYLGVNRLDQKTVLVDTVEYDNRLLELRGNNGTMKFILNSIVIDAHLAGAKKIIIFAAPYGKPINFVNYIKKHKEKQQSITYHEQYYFESIDPYNTALSSSQTSKHHYTVALGYNKPLQGVIDHGYTQVGIHQVEKLIDGNKGVLEIDIEQFIKENKLSPQIPKKEKTDFFTSKMSTNRRPDTHETLIGKRKKEILAMYTELLKEKLSNPKIEIINNAFNDALLEQLLFIEKNSFSDTLRYSIDDIKKRLHQKASQILMIYEDNAPVGFILSYISPYLSNNIVYLDTIGIIAEKQNLGLGHIALQLYSKLSLFDGFSQVYVLTEKGNNSEKLIRFYKKNGFELVSNYYKSNSNLLIKDLSIKITENITSFNTLKNKLEVALKDTLSSPEVDILFDLDHKALQIIIDLEKEFDTDLRYTKNELIERSMYKDIACIVIKDNDTPIAFSLCYYDPSLPSHTIFFDTMAIKNAYQSKGIGKLIVKTMLDISKLSQYSQALFYCKNHSKEGINLIEFYKKLGAYVADISEDKTTMVFSVE